MTENEIINLEEVGATKVTREIVLANKQRITLTNKSMFFPSVDHITIRNAFIDNIFYKGPVTVNPLFIVLDIQMD